MLPGVSAAFSRFERRPRWIDTGGPSSANSSPIGTPPPNNSLKPWEITPAQDAGTSAGSSTDPPGRTPGTFGRRAGPSGMLVLPAGLS
jgi:hypothetical protein